MDLFTGKTYLKIDIANNFGLDKKDWDERIQWFDANEPNLMNLLSQAETPALYFAGVEAWNQTKQGKPTGYPPSLDATSSGLQILAALTGDRSAAELCNLVNTGHRRDAYKLIYECMVEEIGESAKIDRDDCKDAILTSLYGSKAEPKRVFGTGSLLRTFYATMNRLAPAAWELNEAYLSMWNPDALINSWIMPDNFHVHVKVMAPEVEDINFMNRNYSITKMVNKPTEEGRSLGANTTHSVDGMIVREITRRCDYNPEEVQNARRAIFTSLDVVEEIEDTEDSRMVQTLWERYEESGYLSARIIPHINDETIHLVDRSIVLALIESLPPKPFKVITVHD